MKILIATPYRHEFIKRDGVLYSNGKQPISESIKMLSGFMHDVEWYRVKGTCIDRLRNQLINNDKSFHLYQPDVLQDYDYVLFWDCDIYSEEPKKDIQALIDTDCDIVGGVYPVRDDHETITAGYWLENKVGFLQPLKYHHLDDSILPVDWIGCGFLLIKTEVFRKTRYPWFCHKERDDGVYYISTGEDIGFCINAANAGYEINLNEKVRLKHITE